MLEGMQNLLVGDRPGWQGSYKSWRTPEILSHVACLKVKFVNNAIHSAAAQPSPLIRKHS